MPTIAFEFTAILRALFFIELKWWFLWYFIRLDFFTILKPPKFSYRTDLLLMKFLYRIEASRWRIVFDMSFYGCYLPWGMVDVDTTFLYINSVVVSVMRGWSIGYSWSKSNVFFSCTFRYLHLFFLLIAWDFIAIQKVFDIDKLRELGKIVIFELGSHFVTLRVLQITLCQFDVAVI